MPHLIFSREGKQLKGFNALRHRYALFNPRADKIRDGVRIIEGLMKIDDKLQEMIAATDEKILRLKSLSNPEDVTKLGDEIVADLNKLSEKLKNVQDLQQRKLSTSSSESDMSTRTEPVVLTPDFQTTLIQSVVTNETREINTHIKALTDEVIRRAERYAKKAKKLSSEPTRPHRPHIS